MKSNILLRGNVIYHQTSSTHGFKKLDAVLISKSLTFRGRHGLEEKKDPLLEYMEYRQH